jgi:hypothetical protein
MRSTLADAPLVVSTDGTAGPYVRVTVDQLGPVAECLRAQGIAIRVGDDAVMIDGRPALAVIDLVHAADVERVQSILDRLAADWRGAQAGRKSPPASRDELILKVPPSASAELTRRIEDAPAPGWGRRSEIEARSRKLRAGRAGAYCFSRDFEPGPVAVWLEPRGAGEFFVSSIIPLRSREPLSVEQYNRVLDDFEKTVIDPLLRGLNGHIFRYPTPTGPTLEDVLSPDSARLLEDFSATANKERLHPLDVRRWTAFVARTHLEDVVFDTSMLSDWLEARGWPESQRARLVDDYERGRSLLTVYDEERVDR